MKFFRKCRHYWHDFYYAIAKDRGINFALRCQEATAAIDLGLCPDRKLGKIRFWLHLSVCQACKNYYDLTLALRKAIRSTAPALEESVVDIESMSRVLLEKHAIK